MTADGTPSLSAPSEAVWVARLERSKPEQLVEDRRLQLIVTPDGRIVWASTACPASVYGIQPSALVGTSVDTIIDVFAEYCGCESRESPTPLMHDMLACPCATQVQVPCLAG